MSKKLLSVLLTAALLLSMSATALATSNSVTVVAEGDVDYFKPEDVYTLVLPTSNALTFQLDPQGLVALEEGKAGISLADLLASGGAGAVLFNDYVPTVVNESTVPVAVDVTMKIVDSGSSSDAAAIVPVATAAAASDDTSPPNNLFIGVTTSSVNVQTIKDEDNTATNTKANFTGYLQADLTASPQTLTYLPDEGEYLLFKTGEKAYEHKLTVGSGNGFSLLFEGACNPYADWSNYLPTTAASDAAPTPVVLTYAGMGTADLTGVVKITIDSVVFTYNNSADTANKVFATNADLVTCLNAQFTDWTWAIAGANITATADTAGAIGSTGAPTQDDINAIKLADYDTGTDVTATSVDGSDAVTAGDAAPAERTVSISAAFVWDSGTTTTSYQVNTPGAPWLVTRGASTALANPVGDTTAITAIGTAAGTLKTAVGTFETSAKAIANIATAADAYDTALGVYAPKLALTRPGNPANEQLNALYDQLAEMHTLITGAEAYADAVEADPTDDVGVAPTAPPVWVDPNGPARPDADVIIDGSNTAISGGSKAAKWATGNPLTVRIDTTPYPASVKVATSAANMTSAAWKSGTEYSYDADLGLLTIIRVASGTTIVVQADSKNYTITFS